MLSLFHAKEGVRIATLILTATCLLSCTFCMIQAKSLLKSDTINNDKPCETPGCLRMASYLENSIDYNTNPCDDFYQFACGNAIARKKTDPKLTINSFIESMSKVQDEIESLLENEKRYPSEKSQNLVRLRKYYTSCRDKRIRNMLGNKPMLSVIRKLGGFPILGEQSGWLPDSETKITWADRLAKFRALGIKHDIFFALQVQSNPRNNSQTDIYLDEPALDNIDLMLEFGGSEAKAIEYALAVSRMVNLGAGLTTTSLYHMPRVYSLRGKLGDIRNNLQDHYTLIKMNEFETLGLSVNMRKLIQDLVGFELNGDQVINVNYEYLIALNELLSQTDAKVVANYMLYKMSRDLAAYLDDAWQAGLQIGDCVQIVQNELDLAISYEYVKHFVTNEEREGVINLVDKIITQTKVNIEQADWIKGSTMQLAKDKVDAIRSIVAYPEQFKNETFMESILSRFDDLSADDYFGNRLKIVSKDYDYMYDKIGYDQRDSYWELFALTTMTNAFYSPDHNSINILAGIMLGRTFDITSPMYLNFGSIGAVIGHEITHAFDPSGSQYDKFGNKLPKTWWNEETLIGYERNKQCFIEAYDNLPVPGNERYHINGTFTLGENMADNGGYQIAHEAYNLWVAEQGIEKEPTLEDIKFNQDQLFWLSLATTWCDLVDPKISGYLAQSDVHSPPKYRVNIPFSNAKQFSDAFSCQAGTYMNQTKKCVVW